MKSYHAAKYLSFIFFIFSAHSFGAEKPLKAHALLTSPSTKGLEATVQALHTDKGVKVIAEARGLKPGAVHGFHIHEKGECKGPDFKTAGGHFNPSAGPHSSPAAESKHIGDLGNLVANDKGVARTEILIHSEKGTDLNTIMGKAVIIHAKADDLASQPAGNSGDRIACGILKPGSP